MNFRFAAPTMPHSHDGEVGGSSFALRPAWGLAGVAIGTFVAVLLVPSTGYHLPGALVPAGIALSAGLLLGPILSARRHLLTALRMEHLLLIGLVYWLMLDALQSTSRLVDVSPQAVRGVFLYTGLFASALWVGSALASLVIPAGSAGRAAPDVGAVFLFRAALVCFVFGFAEPTATCGFSAACLVDALSAPRFEVPWFTGPGIKGLNTILVNLKYFGYLMLPMLVALYRVERRLTWRSLVLTPLTAAFLLLLLRDGGRKELGTVIGAGLLVWILLQGRPRARHYAIIVGAIAGLLLLMQVMVTWRDVGVTRAFDGSTAVPAVRTGVTVDWSFDWMAHAIQVVPDRAPHVGWNGVIYALGYQIPRSVWTRKPPPHGIDLAYYMGRSYAPGFSWNCTVVGDLYLIGGALAILIGGVLYGIAANLGSRLLFRQRSVGSRLLYAVAAMALFLTLRALWEVTAQGVTVLAVWLLLASHGLARRPLGSSNPGGALP